MKHRHLEVWHFHSLKLPGENPCNQGKCQQEKKHHVRGISVDGTYMIEQLINPHAIMYLISNVHEREVVQVAKQNNLEHVWQNREQNEGWS